MANHIERRGEVWYAVLNIPEDVQKKLRRKRFRVSLKTRDKNVALREAMPYVFEWQCRIARLRGEEAARHDPKIWRNALRRARAEEQQKSVMEQIEMEAWDIGSINVDFGQLPSTSPEAQFFYAEATGAIVPTVEHLDEWLGSLQQVKVKTAKMRQTTIQRLSKKFPMLHDISRKEIRRWVTELLATLKPATVQRMLSDCRTYWAYLATIDVVPEESAPFDRLGLKVPTAARVAWLPEDLVKLHRAAEVKDPVLADLIKLAMYSGARLGELVNLRVTDVAEDHYRITASKTDAGVRVVPIHREVRQTFSRLIEDSADGYVLSGISGKHRVGTMSKAFQRLRKAHGYTDKQRQVFHSIRNTVITMLERAGVPEGTVQDIVGHARSTLTGSIYSGKSTLEMKRDALAKLTY